jgi:hypothetical protein
MKFNDLPADILSIRMKHPDDFSVPLEEQHVFNISLSMTRPGEFEVRLKESVVFLTPIRTAEIRRLGQELARGSSMLAQLANPAKNGSIELQIAFFTADCLEMGDVEIGVDEYVEQRVAKIIQQKLTGTTLYRFLEKQCCYIRDSEIFFFINAGPAIEEDLIEENQDLSAATTIPTLKNSFCISGDGIRFIATQSQLPDGNSVFVATRMKKHSGVRDRSLRLARGDLKFVDLTRAGGIQILAQAQMASLTKESGSYLKKWDEFGDLEGELLLIDARAIGVLQYCDAKSQRDGTTLINITEASDKALNALASQGVEDLERVDKIPDYLQDPEMRFRDFARGIEKEIEQENKNFPRKRKRQQDLSRSYYKVSDFDKFYKSLTLKAEMLPASGTLILSLAGEIAQIKRRMAARKNILTGRAANPQLGPLIEEQGQVVASRAPHKIKPLTAFVRDKVFNNPPTLQQEEAIRLALNTPDIALIQGPPGTGKTTIIAAIVERLNEEADKRGVSFKGEILLTGFQHDAVENMISRLSLNGLPVPKFGKRSDADDYDFDLFEKKLETWCDDLATAIRKKNPQIAEVEQEMEIRNECRQYLDTPTRALATRLVKQIAHLGIKVLGEQLIRRAQILLQRVSRENFLNTDSSTSLDAIRRLRHRPDSFSDDGPQRATEVMEDLKKDLQEPERELLDQASLWHMDDGIPPFLDELASLKQQLLLRFTAPPVFRIEKHSDDITKLAIDAKEKIKAAGASTKDVKSAALAEFLAELENNPYGMINAVSDYSYAFAATCQQSVNKTMQRQKGIDDDTPGQEMEYEYVIVDEAARVSPRDLMIPMANGKRIILVGDHRQLPHIINEKVAAKMDSGETGENEDAWLKKSMFQYLFSERLPALESADDIRRRVTLDKQFRMHPLLGDFVSKSFYERFDADEKFSSGIPDEAEFAHNLPNTQNAPAIWLDVPASLGGFKRAGTSWTRPAETNAIAQLLPTWMASEAGQDLTFGVISFYKAQANQIRKQIGDLSDDPQRLRIGTVDSFQGMEFDVVFLSMVRTTRQKRQKRDGDRQKQAYGLFGHLCLSNRLNVSMSRQQKLLVVVGDSTLLQDDLAPEFIPGLVDFFNLCQESGVIIR